MRAGLARGVVGRRRPRPPTALVRRLTRSCIGMLKIGECDSAMRIDVVDPSAYAPHYDHGLCRALARAGAEVRPVTSDFRYGPVPQADGYDVERAFYRRGGK